jgi:hypothetical protein
MSRPLKYGQITGGNSPLTMRIGASEVFKNLAGKFVVSDTAGRAQLANATDVNILGWMEQGERTASSTEGADTGVVNVAQDAVYEMPACKNDGTALTEDELKACVGETWDIKLVSTNYQYVNANTSSIDILLAVGYRYYGSAVGEQSLLVKVNPDKAVQTSGA